jgi:hypothetical protein
LIVGRLAAGVVIALAGVLVGAAPSVADQAKKPKPKPRFVHYTGKASGGLVWQEHRVSQDANPTPSVVVDQNGEDKGVFTFSFKVDRKTGKVTGSGKGSYTSATWHLVVTDLAGTFTCDVPIQTNRYAVKVTGRTLGSRIRLALTLPDALDTNDDTPCGDYTAYSTPGNSLDYALSRAGGRTLNVPRTRPAPISLSKSSTYSFVDDEASPVVNVDATETYAWSITIRRR